ncbi:MAG: peptidase T [Clostridia bacterium]|nr:peptidase T [Clostridia bacterium]
MRAYERFLKYVNIDTTADSASNTCPSSPNQLILAAELVKEMKEMGIADARVDEYGYVYGSIPASIEGAPTIGLIAHMDTAEDAPASPMNAHIVENYQGGDLVMDEEGKNILRQSEYPMLGNYIGHDLIITDGNTLLGADDKAGIAEIMTFAEKALNTPGLKHGKIAIGFTPDEEIGRGPDHFDYAGFGADFAYTLDGGPLPEIECENFNAASAAIEITGVSTHPGGAKNRMKNAALIAVELINMMPPAERPEHTAGYEGFYHLIGMSGSVEKAKVYYIIRDHDMTKFLARKAFVERSVAYLNEKYGENTIKLELKDSYFNMLEAMKPNMHVMTRAEEAIRKIGFEPRRRAIRGGTDGATLTNNGLPCPNLPTGGMFAHGRRECICIQEMDKIVEMIEKIICED